MSYCTSLYDDINFFIYCNPFTAWGGIKTSLKNSEKNFLRSLDPGTSVIKVGSVKSKILFCWDTLTNPSTLPKHQHQFHWSLYAYFFNIHVKWPFDFPRNSSMKRINSVLEYHWYDILHQHVPPFERINNLHFAKQERLQSNIKRIMKFWKWLCMHFCRAQWPVELMQMQYNLDPRPRWIYGLWGFGLVVLIFS